MKQRIWIRTAFGRLAELTVVPVVVIAGWWLLSASSLYPKGLIPGPEKTLSALVDWIVGGGGGNYSGTWVESALASTRRVMLGYVIGSACGIVAGGLLGYFAQLGRMVEPFIHMLRAIPMIGWLPLAFVLFGFGITSAIFLIALGTFFPVVVNTIGGVRGVDRNLMRVGRMVGAGSPLILRSIVLPSAMPSIVTGLRVAMGFAWILVIVAEWMAVRSGLGHVLLDAYNFVRYDYVIAAMISVGFMGFLFDRLVSLLLRPLVRWHIETSFQG